MVQKVGVDVCRSGITCEEGAMSDSPAKREKEVGMDRGAPGRRNNHSKDPRQKWEEKS